MDRSVVCQNCHASLEDDQFASTGVAECPFCGAPLPNLGSSLATDVDSRSITDQSAEPAALVAGLPAGSRVQLIEAGRDRQVIYIPPGGKETTSLGCFALFWNLFMLVFTGAWLGPAGHGGLPIAPFFFFGLFWAVGLGMLYFWIRMRFTRTYLLLERERIAIQRILFGRRTTVETLLGPDSKATLVEAYRSNDVPVHTVTINGLDGAAKFGTPLSRPEKDWFVETINGFLGKVETIDPILGTPAATRVDFENLRPDQLPADSEVTIGAADNEQLRFSLVAFPRGKARIITASFAFLFGLFWFGVTIAIVVAALPVVNQAGDWITFFIHGLMVLADLLPFSLAAFTLFGRIEVDIARDRVSCRWGLGRMEFRRSVPTASITRVVVAVPMLEKSGAASPRRPAAVGDVRVCLLFAGQKMIPLTTFHSLRTACEVAGLTRGHLRRLGFEMPDE